MRTLKKTIISDYPPNDSEVLWMKPENGKYVLYVCGNKGWESVTGAQLDELYNDGYIDATVKEAINLKNSEKEYEEVITFNQVDPKTVTSSISRIKGNTIFYNQYLPGTADMFMNQRTSYLRSYPEFSSGYDKIIQNNVPYLKLGRRYDNQDASIYCYFSGDNRNRSKKIYIPQGHKVLITTSFIPDPDKQGLFYITLYGVTSKTCASYNHPDPVGASDKPLTIHTLLTVSQEAADSIIITYFSNIESSLENRSLLSKDLITHRTPPQYESFPEDSDIVIKIFNMALYDLTMMFGEGNEPTEEEFFKMFPNYCYPTTMKVHLGSQNICTTSLSPILMSLNTQSIKTVGFNQLNLMRTEMVSIPSTSTTPKDFNENQIWLNFAHNGHSNTNTYDIQELTANKIVAVSSSNAISGYGLGFPIKVFPNTSYYVNAELTNGNIYIGFFDYRGVNISYLTSQQNKTFTTPADCVWCVVIFKANASNTEMTVENPVLNLSHTGYRNGEYEVYKQEERQLPIKTYFPNGMNANDYAFDELTQTHAIQRVKVVNVEDMGWEMKEEGMFAVDDYMPFPSYPTSDRKVRCDWDYTCDPNGVADMCYTLEDEGSIWVNDSSCSTLEAFITKNTGKKMIIDLKEEDYVITPIAQNLDMFLVTPYYGTVKAESDNYVPLTLDILKSKNVLDLVMNGSNASVESLTTRVDSLEANIQNINTSLSAMLKIATLPAEYWDYGTIEKDPQDAWCSYDLYEMPEWMKSLVQNGESVLMQINIDLGMKFDNEPEAQNDSEIYLTQPDMEESLLLVAGTLHYYQFGTENRARLQYSGIILFDSTLEWNTEKNIGLKIYAPNATQVSGSFTLSPIYMRVKNN